MRHAMDVKKTKCFYCNEEGHMRKDCPKKLKDYLARLTCFSCGGTGHVKRDCPALKKQNTSYRKGSPLKHPSTQSNQATRLSKAPAESTAHVQHTDRVQSPPATPHVRTGACVGEFPRNHVTSPLTAPDKDTNTTTGKSTVASSSSHAQITPPALNGKPPSTISSVSLPLQAGVESLSNHGTKSGGDKVVDKKRVPFPPFVDTHCHLEYVFDRYEHRGNLRTFAEMQKYPKNFDGCISTFCDPAAFSSSFGSWSDIISEPNVWGTFGIHPHNAKYYYSNGVELEDKLLKCLEHSKCVAFGEIGLDYSDHSPSDPKTQREIFAHQLQLALPFGKPLVLHCRDAEEELHHILSKHIPSEWFIHLHCFTGSVETAKRFLDDFPNLYLGVCGNVTNQRQVSVRKIASEVPLGRLLIETDAPYMTPYNLPKAGRCRFNHPALAFYVAKEIARLRKSDLGDVLSRVRENTTAIYGV